MLPSSPGVYAMLIPGRPAHISWSNNLQRRIGRLLRSPYAGSATLLRKLEENAACVRCWPTASKLESSLLTYQLGKQYHPGDYLKRLRLRIPWFLAILTDDEFPRLTLSNRDLSTSGPLWGPFVNRDTAQHYEQAVLDLFQMRRCTDILHPAPDHPGCIYGEMNQCLRPCQASVSPDEYRTEAGRVAEFLSTNGRHTIAALSMARGKAADQMHFEEAAQLHKRLERLAGAAAIRPAVVSDLSNFSGVALTRGASGRQLRLTPMVNGLWQDAATLDLDVEPESAQSLDLRVREHLKDALTSIRTEGKRMEELAVFSRWYYSSWRDGEWFPFHTLADLNYRKLVRAISNLLKSAKEPTLKSSPC